MANYGYDKSRFPNLTGQSFDCIICTGVVREPKECHGCGNLYCSACINDWYKKNSSCPNRCPTLAAPLTSKILLKMYNDLDVRCVHENCKKLVKLFDLAKHEATCQRVKCWNFQNCQELQANPNSESFPCCSNRCAFLKALMNAGGNQKKMYEEIKAFLSKSPDALIKKDSSMPGNSLVSKAISFKWDNSKAGQGIEITDGGMTVFLKEQSYVFRTVVSEACFMSGTHYWEIIADPRTENELKIGVTTNRDFDLNSAFCDHAFGYAYYGLGQLRHNSNASGNQYGKRFKKEGVLGVFLNMNKGTLSFALNGEYMGVAFNIQALKKGPIYPAVSLLHCAGCKIRTGPAPSYFTQ